MPGIVSHVYFISLLFWEWGLLSLTLSLSLSLSLCVSLSLSLSVPSILWCSVSQPTTYNEIFRRMVTKSNCFIWMMHLGIYVLFSTVIVISFFLCCSCKLSPFFSLSLHSIFTFSCFLYMDWLCLFTSHLHPFLSTYLSPSLSRMCSMWECCDCFDWSLCCIWRLLIGWIFYFFWFVTHSWSCDAPISGCV